MKTRPQINPQHHEEETNSSKGAEKPALGARNDKHFRLDYVVAEKPIIWQMCNVQKGIQQSHTADQPTAP